MAKTSSRSKKKTSKTSKASKKTTTPKKAQAPVMPPEPPTGFLSRNIGAVVFVFLFILALVSYFNTDGTVIRFFSNLIKGLIGWGFWAIAPVCLLVAAILATNKDRPVGFRVFCAFMLPILIAAVLNLMLYRGGSVKTATEFLELFTLGQELKCGGIISGMIAIALKDAFSLYAAYPILIIAFAFCLWKSFDFKFAKMIERRENAVKEAKAAKAPAAVAVDPVLVPDRKRTSKQQEIDYTQPKRQKTYDIPLGDEKIDSTAVIDDDALFGKPAVKPAAVPVKRTPAGTKRVPIKMIDRAEVE